MPETNDVQNQFGGQQPAQVPDLPSQNIVTTSGALPPEQPVPPAQFGQPTASFAPLQPADAPIEPMPTAPVDFANNPSGPANLAEPVYAQPEPQEPQTPSIGFAATPPPISTDIVEPAPAPGDNAAAQVVSEPLVAWGASEYVHHSKGIEWMAGFALFAVAVLVLGIVLLKDWFITVGFVVMLGAVGFMAFRPPRTVRYELHSEGVIIGGKPHLYSEFQSFGVIKEGHMWSILLMPTARFSPPYVLYFEEAQGEDIVDVLGSYLPMEDHQPDAVDRLASRIRL